MGPNEYCSVTQDVSAPASAGGSNQVDESVTACYYKKSFMITRLGWRGEMNTGMTEKTEVKGKRANW